MGAFVRALAVVDVWRAAQAFHDAFTAVFGHHGAAATVKAITPAPPAVRVQPALPYPTAVAPPPSSREQAWKDLRAHGEGARGRSRKRQHRARAGKPGALAASGEGVMKGEEERGWFNGWDDFVPFDEVSLSLSGSSCALPLSLAVCRLIMASLCVQMWRLSVCRCDHTYTPRLLAHPPALSLTLALTTQGRGPRQDELWSDVLRSAQPHVCRRPLGCNKAVVTGPLSWRPGKSEAAVWLGVETNGARIIWK